MLKQIIIIILLIAIPLITIIFGLLYYFSYDYHVDVSKKAVNLPSLLILSAFLNAIYSLLLVIIAFFVKYSNKTLHEKNISLEHGWSILKKENKTLLSRVDLLSATREISLIITHEIESAEILSKSLEIISHFITSSIELMQGDERNEITVFLKDEVTGRLVQKAQRKYQKIIFEDESSQATIDWRNVESALEHSRLFLSADGETLDFTIPLIADREAIGVLKVKIVYPEREQGASSSPAKHIQDLQDNLMELARVLALAVKTPLLYNRTITDSLTSLYTKRHLFNELPVYMEISKRHNSSLSLIIFDIDHFKKVNDTYGHLTGDIVLKEVTEILKQTLRATSTAYRYGGEEIAIILPHTSRDRARVFAERLRKKVANHSFNTEGNEKIKLTISLGIAEYSQEMTDFKKLISQADIALYRAKQNGRNQTVIV